MLLIFFSLYYLFILLSLDFVLYLYWAFFCVVVAFVSEERFFSFVLEGRTNKETKMVQ